MKIVKGKLYSDCAEQRHVITPDKCFLNKKLCYKVYFPISDVYTPKLLMCPYFKSLYTVSDNNRDVTLCCKYTNSIDYISAMPNKSFYLSSPSSIHNIVKCSFLANEGFMFKKKQKIESFRNYIKKNVECEAKVILEKVTTEDISMRGGGVLNDTMFLNLAFLKQRNELK